MTVSSVPTIKVDMGWEKLPINQAIALGLPKQACFELAKAVLMEKFEEGLLIDEDLDKYPEFEVTEDCCVPVVLAKAVGLGTSAVQVLCLNGIGDLFPVREAETAAILLGLKIGYEWQKAQGSDTPFVVINDCKDATNTVRALLGTRNHLVKWNRRHTVSAAHRLKIFDAKIVSAIRGYKASICVGDEFVVSVDHLFPSSEGKDHETLGDWALDEIITLHDSGMEDSGFVVGQGDRWR